jgi:regulator of cell morphogenesis and NO signaling
MTIGESTTVSEIALTQPSSVRVFQRHGIDFCCGGKKALRRVCEESGLSFTDIAAEIEESTVVDTGESRDWSQEPLRSLTAHIVSTYHEPLREVLPQLEAMAEKVVRAHGARAPYLTRLHAIVSELADDLLAHMKKEEVALFPAIEAIEAGRLETMPITPPIAMMEHEHDRAGELLAELRALTDGYHTPEWACTTLHALYSGLERFESDMHIHVHLENNVLFPRAIGAADERWNSSAAGTLARNA